MKIIKVTDYEMDNKLAENIQELLIECFGDDYPKNRIYFKQVPHFRFLVFSKNNGLMGQVGLDYRVMILNGIPVRVLGVIDLCVHREFRSRGIGSLLLAEIEDFCRDKNIDFLLLFAANKRLYLQNGYRNVYNKCKWLKIDEKDQTTYDIGHEVIDDLMIKEIGNVRWGEGDLDLLGYLY